MYSARWPVWRWCSRSLACRLAGGTPRSNVVASGGFLRFSHQRLACHRPAHTSRPWLMRRACRASGWLQTLAIGVRRARSAILPPVPPTCSLAHHHLNGASRGDHRPFALDLVGKLAQVGIDVGEVTLQAGAELVMARLAVWRLEETVLRAFAVAREQIRAALVGKRLGQPFRSGLRRVVFLAEERLLATSATLRHVVRQTRDDQSRPSCHARSYWIFAILLILVSCPRMSPNGKYYGSSVDLYPSRLARARSSSALAASPARW